jgi:hypothetical protein
VPLLPPCHCQWAGCHHPPCPHDRQGLNFRAEGQPMHAAARCSRRGAISCPAMLLQPRRDDAGRGAMMLRRSAPRRSGRLPRFWAQPRLWAQSTVAPHGGLACPGGHLIPLAGFRARWPSGWGHLIPRRGSRAPPPPRPPLGRGPRAPRSPPPLPSPPLTPDPRSLPITADVNRPQTGLYPGDSDVPRPHPDTSRSAAMFPLGAWDREP